MEGERERQGVRALTFVTRGVLGYRLEAERT